MPAPDKANEIKSVIAAVGTNVVDVTAEVSPVQLSVEYAKGAG